MWQAAIALFGRARLYLAIAGAALLLLVGLIAKERGDAVAKYRARAERARAKATQTARRIDDEVRNEDDDALDRRLDKWVRDRDGG